MDIETKASLVAGVRERLESGVSEDEIKKELLAAGYNGSDILEVFLEASGNQSSDAQLDSTASASSTVVAAAEPTPPKKKKHWALIILGILGALIIGWIVLVSLLPDKLIFRSYQSDLQTVTEQYYEENNGDYSGFCQSQELNEIFEEIKVLAQEVLCDSSPGGFNIVVKYDEVTYNCVPAVSSSEMKNNSLLCQERSRVLSDEEREIRDALQQVSDDYASMEPDGVVSRVEEIAIRPTTHTFPSGVSLAKMTLPYDGLPDEYDIDSAQMIAGKLVLTGGYVPRLVIVGGYVPECIQQLGRRPQFHITGELDGTFVATVHPQQSESYIIHGCRKVGEQYLETKYPVVVNDDIAYIVESDPRSSQQFIVYKGKEYAKFSSRIEYVQGLDGEVAFVATPRDKDMYVIQKGDTVLAEIPKTESLAKFVTDGSNYFYMIRGRYDDPDTYFKNGTEVAMMPDELKSSSGFVGPFSEQRLRAETGGLVRFAGKVYDFGDLTFGSVDAYALDGHLLVVVPQSEGDVFMNSVYFDPAAPWADRLIESVNFMYKYAGVEYESSQVQDEAPDAAVDGDNSTDPQTDQSAATQLLSASPLAGTAPLTVTFQHSYEYPDTYAGSRELILGIGDAGTFWDGSEEYFTFSEPGVYEAQLLGCDVSIDRACTRVVLDSIEITVKAQE